MEPAPPPPLPSLPVACADFVPFFDVNVNTAAQPEGFTEPAPFTLEECCRECKIVSPSILRAPCFALVIDAATPNYCYMKRGDHGQPLTTPSPGMTAYMLQYHPPSPPYHPPLPPWWDTLPWINIIAISVGTLLLLAALSLGCACMCYRCALRRMGARHGSQPVLSSQQRRTLKAMTFEGASADDANAHACSSS